MATGESFHSDSRLSTFLVGMLILLRRQQMKCNTFSQLHDSHSGSERRSELVGWDLDTSQACDWMLSQIYESLHTLCIEVISFIRYTYDRLSPVGNRGRASCMSAMPETLRLRKNLWRLREQMCANEANARFSAISAALQMIHDNYVELGWTYLWRRKTWDIHRVENAFDFRYKDQAIIWQ